jgi:hypothetical protein
MQLKGWGLNAGGSDHIPHIKKRIYDFFETLREIREKSKGSSTTNEKEKEPLKLEDLESIPTPEILTFPGEGNSYR